MIVLALESTAKIAAAALCRDDHCLAEFHTDNLLTHSEQLLPMAKEVCHMARVTWDDIDLFACTAGPGSFTGVRIAVSVVKGLAFERNKPCAPVSTLASLAQNLFPLDGLYCPVMDARCDQYYTALFRNENGSLQRVTPDEALSKEDIISRLKAQNRPIYLSGDGYDSLYELFLQEGLPVKETPILLRGQSAVSTAICALKMVETGELADDRKLLPIYLRQPKAERDRQAKHQQGPTDINDRP